MWKLLIVFSLIAAVNGATISPNDEKPVEVTSGPDFTEGDEIPGGENFSVAPPSGDVEERFVGRKAKREEDTPVQDVTSEVGVPANEEPPTTTAAEDVDERFITAKAKRG